MALQSKIYGTGGVSDAWNFIRGFDSAFMTPLLPSSDKIERGNRYPLAFLKNSKAFLHVEERQGGGLLFRVSASSQRGDAAAAGAYLSPFPLILTRSPSPPPVPRRRVPSCLRSRSAGTVDTTPLSEVRSALSLGSILLASRRRWLRQLSGVYP
ncbi:hypothetical protein CVT26_005520 [Gymnopilus dilepis]|uniref:Uncharacterized protein n=1 Tax=Gymnopilus dilepis TaxID=231916 RepID=A0A409W881_9AGAR|nr:hypothetical protein CVT26_005520 [Gymnopilus dilepis]